MTRAITIAMPRGQRGFSLAELMVALVLSLVLLAGALSILYSSRISYAENEKLARVQETGRTVMELVVRDIRAAGFNGCARPMKTGDFVNDIDLEDEVEEALFDFERPVGGYEAGGTGESPTWATAGDLPSFDDALAPDASALSDIVILRASREGEASYRTTAELAGTSVPVAFGLGSTIVPGATFLVADCQGASTFRATSFTETVAATATTPGAGNLTFSSASGGALTRGFMPGATLVPVEAVVYFVAPGSAGTGTSLWQKLGNADPQELVEGVESMQVRYGIDTTVDRVPDAYVTASGVTNWNNVVSMQVAFLVRSDQEYGSEIDGRTYQLLGTSFGPFNDRRYRTVFTTTVAVRNRSN